MDTASIRQAVLAAIGSIAPESEAALIRPDQPLLDQIELDSMDWINLIAVLGDRLQLEIPPSDTGRLTTLDAIVAYITARQSEPRTTSPRPPGDAAAELPHTRHVINGTPVTLRPMHADDAPLEDEFVRSLSSESRYKRFMVTLRELPPKKLAYLTDVDEIHHVALVATVDRDGREALIGVARYVVDPSGTSCEFAIAVADAWQGSGVAGILMHTLMDTARARGLTRMEGLVLATNRRMLHFTRQLGFSLEHDPDDRDTLRAVRTLN
ncbi:MAG TPA: GNAT family N-acetyltransferase [Albitalea sp.]|nr:GNAT family N-acetyltransferase [Albitalea sp.]